MRITSHTRLNRHETMRLSTVSMLPPTVCCVWIWLGPIPCLIQSSWLAYFVKLEKDSERASERALVFVWRWWCGNGGGDGGGNGVACKSDIVCSNWGISMNILRGRFHSLAPLFLHTHTTTRSLACHAIPLVLYATDHSSIDKRDQKKQTPTSM